VTRYYLDTTAHIERWGGEKALREGIKNLLGDEAHATSTHVLREWKGIVDDGAADVLNLFDEGNEFDLPTLFARLGQGMYRGPGQALRVLTMLSGDGTIDANVTTRARTMIRTLSRKLFERQINDIRDASECGLARNEATEDKHGNWTLVKRCKKGDKICRQDDFIHDHLARAQDAADALIAKSERPADKKMGENMQKGIKNPPDRKGVNCYGGTGDISIALECGKSETLLTTDKSYDIICPAIGRNLKRIPPTRNPKSKDPPPTF
jgi:hypothetical protein